jgi:hypothetical protein
MNAEMTGRLAKTIPAHVVVAALIAMSVVRGVGAQETLLLVHGASKDEAEAIGDCIRKDARYQHTLVFKEAAPLDWYLREDIPVWATNIAAEYCTGSRWQLDVVARGGEEALARGDNAAAIRTLAPVVKSLACLEGGLVAEDHVTLGRATFLLALALHRRGSKAQAEGLFQQAAAYWPVEDSSEVTARFAAAELGYDEGKALEAAVLEMASAPKVSVIVEPGSRCFIDGTEISGSDEIRQGLHAIQCQGREGTVAARLSSGVVELLSTKQAVLRLLAGDQSMGQLAMAVHEGAVAEGFSSALLLDPTTGGVARIDGTSGTAVVVAELEPSTLGQCDDAAVGEEEAGSGNVGDTEEEENAENDDGRGGTTSFSDGAGPPPEVKKPPAGRTAGVVLTALGGATAAGGLVFGLQQWQTSRAIYNEAHDDTDHRQDWYEMKRLEYEGAVNRMQIGYGIAIVGGVVTAAGLATLIVSSVRASRSNGSTKVGLSIGVKMDDGQVHGAMVTLYSLPRW